MTFFGKILRGAGSLINKVTGIPLIQQKYINELYSDSGGSTQTVDINSQIQSSIDSYLSKLGTSIGTSAGKEASSAIPTWIWYAVGGFLLIVTGIFAFMGFRKGGRR